MGQSIGYAYTGQGRLVIEYCCIIIQNLLFLAIEVTHY